MDSMTVYELPQIGEDPEASSGPDAFCDRDPFEHETAGNHFTFYPRGRDRLEALIELIDGAQSSVRMFYFMFLDDETGKRVRRALVEAVGRGVDVEVLIDCFGSERQTSQFDELTAAGGKFAAFLSRFGSRYLVRNHQKMTIIDDEVAMIGGFNISEHYFAPPDKNGWNDMGLKVRGGAVDELLRWYKQLSRWTNSRKQKFRAIRALVRNWKPAEGPVSLVLNGPTRVPSSWAMQVKRDFARATRLDMAMAYFSPPRSYRRLIARIAQRGGQVRLIMAGKSDNTTTIAASRALYGRLLQAGARVYEFQPCKMHTKLLVVDDVTYVGSANFDMRSLRLNLELMLRIEDAELAAKMREHLDCYAPHSSEVTLEDHRKHATWWNRLRWWAGWLIVGVLDYTVTRKLNIGA